MKIQILSTASVAALAMAPLAGMMAPMTAAAQARTISLPAMPMAEALRRIASETGRTITVDPDAVEGLQSSPVIDARDAAGAVRQATRGTAVAVRIERDGAIAVLNDVVVTARRDEAEMNVLVRGDTTSSRTGQSLRDQPRNTQVISSRLMQEQQAQTLSDALRNAGGVVVNSATIQNGVGYSIRGFSSNGSVNGLPTASSSSFAAGTSQPLANIERLEVLKGPDAILLGGDNIGGTVNVVTKKPSAEERLYLSAETGSFGHVRGTIDANRAISDDNRLSARIIATVSDDSRNFGGYRGNEDYLFAPSLRYKNATTDIIVGATLSNQISGAIPYTVVSPTTRRPFDVPFDRPLVGDKNQFTQNVTTQFNAEITQKLTDWMTVVARAQHVEQAFKLAQWSPFALFSPTGDLLVANVGVNQRANNDALDGYARVNFDTGIFNHRIVAGVTHVKTKSTADSAPDGTFEVYNFLTRQPLLPPLPTTYDFSFSVNTRQTGYYAQYLLKVWQLNLLAGVRRNDTRVRSVTTRSTSLNEAQATTPNFGAVLDVTKDISIYGSLAYGFQPTYNLDRNRQQLPDVHTRNAEAGVKVDLFGDRVLVNASWFSIRQSNRVLPDPLFPNNPNISAALPGLEGKGIDLNISGEPLRGLSVVGTYTRTTYRNLTPIASGNVVQAQPRDQYSFYASYRHTLSDTVSGGLGSGVFGRSSSAIDTRGLFIVPAALQVDLNGFLNIGKFDVNLGVRNLFDRQNFAPTVSPNYLPLGEPRNWRLTVGYRFR